VISSALKANRSRDAAVGRARGPHRHDLAVCTAPRCPRRGLPRGAKAAARPDPRPRRLVAERRGEPPVCCSTKSPRTDPAPSGAVRTARPRAGVDDRDRRACSRAFRKPAAFTSRLVNPLTLARSWTFLNAHIALQHETLFRGVTVFSRARVSPQSSRYAGCNFPARRRFRASQHIGLFICLCRSRLSQPVLDALAHRYQTPTPIRRGDPDRFDRPRPARHARLAPARRRRSCPRSIGWRPMHLSEARQIRMLLAPTASSRRRLRPVRDLQSLHEAVGRSVWRRFQP
jgi:hypothetical protein